MAKKEAHPERNGPDLLRLLAKTDFIPSFPRDVQIASHLREILQKQQIPAQTKLPSVRALAKLWDTTYNVVHDALKELSGEGVVILRPVRGCFVAPPRRTLRRVCIYHNGPPHTTESSLEFYVHLDLEINNQLLKRGIAIIPFYDRRATSKLHTAPPELRAMAGEGKIDAVIATEIFPKHTPWLFQLEVPVASLMFSQPERRIKVDFSALATKVIALAVKSGRKVIGLIHEPMDVGPRQFPEGFFRLELERQALAQGISVVVPRPPTHHHMQWERFSLELCKQLLESSRPPDMIFVYPDTFIRGVALALDRHQVQIPEKILVVSHRNEEIGIYVPFPITWITVKIADFAAALINQIDRQIAGEKLTSTTIALKTQETAPFLAPS